MGTRNVLTRVCGRVIIKEDKEITKKKKEGTKTYERCTK